jgi:hypothetical protein
LTVRGVLAAISDFYGNNTNNPSSRFLVLKNLDIEPKIMSLAQILRVMAILMISGGGGYIGFKKMPMDKILHSLRKIFVLGLYKLISIDRKSL